MDLHSELNKICGATRRGSPKGLGRNVAIERSHDGVTKSVSGLKDPDFLGSNCPKDDIGELVTMMPILGQFAAEL